MVSNSIGMMEWPVQQIVPAFSEAFPHIFGSEKNVLCLVPMAIDQSPYFRTARDYATRLGFPKSAMICGKFLPSLLGDNDKMSSTGDSNHATIFLNSTPEDIKSKINKYALSGGKATMKEHRELGGDVVNDMAFRYLTFFEESDSEIERIDKEYSSGRMLSGELKSILINKLTIWMANHQEKRSKVTDEVIKRFMAVRWE